MSDKKKLPNAATANIFFIISKLGILFICGKLHVVLEDFSAATGGRQFSRVSNTISIAEVVPFLRFPSTPF